MRARVATSRPSTGASERAALARVLAGGYFGAGPECRAFESELSGYLGGRGVLCVNSGTAALHVALAALGLEPGDEVLVPSLTFVACFQAVRAAGAVPVACDVRLRDGLLDLADARARVSQRTRAIMPVHYAGNPGSLRALYAFARRHGLRVVEDAAHAFGSAVDGVRVGAGGDIVCFSFDPIKNITCGQGGAVVSADAEILERVARMRNLGIVPGAGESYAVEGPGWRYQMSDLQAAIGRVQLGRFESELKPHRVRLAAQYERALSAIPGVSLLRGGTGVVPHIFPVRIGRGRRDDVRAGLAEEGFETRVHYFPNHLRQEFATHRDCPRATRLYAELVSLPLHAGVASGDIRRIARIISRIMSTRPSGTTRPGGR